MAFIGRQGHQNVASLEDWSILKVNKLYQAVIRQLEMERAASDRANREMDNR